MALAREQVGTSLCHCLDDHVRSRGSGLAAATFQILGTYSVQDAALCDLGVITG